MRPPASALRPPAAGPAHHFPDAGCLLWRSGATRLFFRCPTRFRHRPSQADLLHVDLEWRGQPIVHDAGTYSYNTSGRLSGALKEASVHNTVTYDSAEPMQKAGRFLYLPWPRGTAGWNSTADQFHAEHDGWQTRGLRHRRSVQSPRADEFIVTDELAGTGPHRGRLHWLVADGPYDLDLGRQRLILRTAAGDYAISWQVPGGSVTLVRGDPDSNRGWWAPHYAQAEPALSLAIEFEFTGECRIETKFGPA